MEIRKCDINEFELSVTKKQTERQLEIIEAIETLMFRRQLLFDSVNGFPGTFPALRKKYLNQIDTLNGCINKLNKKISS